MVATRYIWNELTDNVAVEKDDQGNVTQYTQRPELYGRVLSQDRNGTRLEATSTTMGRAPCGNSPTAPAPSRIRRPTRRLGGR